VLDSEVVAAMMAPPRRDAVLERLTPRQREVLAVMAEGRSNGAIAESLTLTTKAVVRHVSHIWDTLGLEPTEEDRRRVLAVVRYLSA
jgi:DNA-binding NarL/FixJ family response regulator